MASISNSEARRRVDVDPETGVVTCIDCGAELMTAHIEESFRKRRNKVRQVVVEHEPLETCYGELRHGAEA